MQKSSSREGRGNGEEAAGHGVEGMEREGERGEEEEEAEDEVGSLSWRLQTLERELQLDAEDGLLEEEEDCRGGRGIVARGILDNVGQEKCRGRQEY